MNLRLLAALVAAAFALSARAEGTKDEAATATKAEKPAKKAKKDAKKGKSGGEKKAEKPAKPKPEGC